MIDMYHGSVEKVVDDLVAGNIDINRGGGEIGQGFYLGSMLHEAKAWAYHKHDSRRVLKVEIEDEDFFGFNPLALTEEQTMEKRKYIRKTNQQRTYKFNEDFVWTPIVGSTKVKGDQYKWESAHTEVFLNGTKVRRSKV